MAKTSRKADGAPAFQFYVDDWLSETELMLCSLAAQGLWIRLLCHMWKSPRRGYLQIVSTNSKSMANDSKRSWQAYGKMIARLVGEDVGEITFLLAELEEHGVLERDEDGTIYNRRMARGGRLSEIRSEAGKRGAKGRWG